MNLFVNIYLLSCHHSPVCSDTCLSPHRVTTLPAPTLTLLTESGHFTGPAQGLTGPRSHVDAGKMQLLSTYYELNLNFARKSIHYAAAAAL